MKFRNYRNLSRSELMKALQAYNIDLTYSDNEEIRKCLRFRSMVFMYIARDQNFMTEHYETCLFCRNFIEALDNARPKQKTLNGDLKVD